MPRSEPGALGSAVEEAAGRKYGLEGKAGSTGFYDAKYRTNGGKVQIKSASHSRADGPGVFRFWKGHLEALQDVQGSVVLGVVSRESDAVLKLRKRSATNVLIACRGEWRESGQADMKGKKEARIPWPELVSL